MCGQFQCEQQQDQDREVRMLVRHEGLLNSWPGVLAHPAAANSVGRTEPTFLNGEESGKVGVARAGTERQEA